MNGTDRFEFVNGEQPPPDELAEISAAIKALCEGSTPWQAGVSRKLRTLSNEMIVLMGARVVWPSVAMLSALAMGGFAGELVFRLLGGHR